MHVCAKSFQSCLTLCIPMDCSPPGSSVHGILQARILERVAIRSRGSSWPRYWTHISCLLHCRWIFTTSTTWAAPICLYGFVFQTQLKLLKRGYVLPQRWWSSNPRPLQPRKFFGKILPKMYLLFQFRPKGNKEVNYCVSSLMLYNKLLQKMI